MIERRRDPRTSKPYSLANLLRMRAEREGILCAVVGTPEGIIMASSREGQDAQAAQLAAHASLELFGPSPRGWFNRGTGLRALGLRVDAPCGPCFVAALVKPGKAISLEMLAAAVVRILNEPVPQLVAA